MLDQICQCHHVDIGVDRDSCWFLVVYQAYFGDGDELDVVNLPAQECETSSNTIHDFVIALFRIFPIIFVFICIVSLCPLSKNGVE